MMNVIIFKVGYCFNFSIFYTYILWYYFFYYKMKDNRYVAGYTALDSIFNRKSSMKRDGNSAMKEIINQSFGY